MRDTYHGFKAVTALAAAVLSANTNGVAVDLKGFDSALFIVGTGAIEAAGDFTVKLQESDTGTSSWSDVAEADLLDGVPGTLEADSAYRIGYIGSKRKRYVRAVAVKGGGTSIALSVVALLGHPAIAPVA